MSYEALTIRTYPAHGELARYIQAFWILDSPADAAPELRYLHPDGGSGLTLFYGGHIEIDGHAQEAGVSLKSRIAAPSVWRFSGSMRIVGLRFHPGGAFPFFRTSFPTEDSCPQAELRELYDRVEGAVGLRETISILESWLFRRLGRVPLSSVAEAALQKIRTGTFRVERIAKTLDVTPRHLERLFREQVGYPPKQLARFFRARRAKRMLFARPNVPLFDLAYDLGYSDQAHFTREFKSVIGLTPGAYRILKAGS